MSKSAQPYKLGSGGSVGGTVAKSFADVGTAISDAITARSSVKKHQAGLQHLAEQAQLDHERFLEVNNQSQNHKMATIRQVNTFAKGGTKVTHGDMSYTKAADPKPAAKKPPVKKPAVKKAVAPKGAI